MRLHHLAGFSRETAHEFSAELQKDCAPPPPLTADERETVLPAGSLPPG